MELVCKQTEKLIRRINGIDEKTIAKINLSFIDEIYKENKDTRGRPLDIP